MTETRPRSALPQGYRARRAALAGGLVLLAGVATTTALTPAAAHAAVAAAATQTAPAFKVVSEGLTPETAARLAAAAGIGNALRPDGSFSFVDPARYAALPQTDVAKGTDEQRRPTLSQALDLKAVEQIRVVSDADALKKAAALLPVPSAYRATRTVGHTRLDQSDAKGNVLFSKDLDTTVSSQLTLDGLPVVGPGAKQRVVFAGDGSVTQLTQSVRDLAPGGSVDIISPDAAAKACSVAYGPGVGQGTPVLGYQAPALAATDKASGTGPVKLILPHYICQPLDAKGNLPADRFGGKLIPASPALTPTVKLTVKGDGGSVSASASAALGTAPYTYQWSSSSVVLPTESTLRANYDLAPRKGADEQLTLTVTDANGISASASVVLPGGAGSATVTSTPTGPGGAFASNGIEQMVNEWQCAQDSANGFRSQMLGHSQTVSFDWRGYNAWERDFKDPSVGGDDSSYVDNVDAQWYTGHGNSSGFTFKSAIDDTQITPSDARWGNKDLEWLQLESCQVLRDTNGHNDYFGRWGQAFRGLHLLNGFDTSAYCIGGGTGGRFASYLFPETFLWWTTRQPLTVQQSWAQMANDLEPSGVRWRSISPATTGWVTNLGDHYWGQGSVGPDIAPGNAANPLIGYVAISGVV
jgi:hypothetical protein